MGIALQELLSLEFFNDFEVVAGRKGLGKEVQGITSLEAPDCFKWAKGKELVFSSGYVIAQDPQCIRRALNEGSFLRTSGLMIKRERYLDKIPQDIIDICEEHDIPLISIPFSVPWMDISNETNIAVMNRTMRRMQIYSSMLPQVTNQTYKEQKVRQILKTVEGEMHFPAMLYDIADDRSYYSSDKFSRILKKYELEETDLWEPRMKYTSAVLCDYIRMTRIRLIKDNQEIGPRISWILIPIKAGGIVRAYFVVMEDRDFIDYYDEFTVRIAFITINGMYEQIQAAKNAGEIGFENFVHFALTSQEKDRAKLAYQAGAQGISINTGYLTILMQRDSDNTLIRSERLRIMAAFQASKFFRKAKLVILDEAEALILMEKTEGLNPEKMTHEEVCAILEENIKDFMAKLKETAPGLAVVFGMCQDVRTLDRIRENVEKCRLVIQRGRNILPHQQIWKYEQLGPLTWLQIPDDELARMLSKYTALMKDEKNIDLLRTLKVYLENNMNFSITAEKMFVHINTIRKRIDKIKELLDMDWDQPLERMKAELLLQYLNL